MQKTILTAWVCLLWAGHAHTQNEKQPVFDAYFSFIESKTADQLPLSDDVTFYGSLLSEPIVGRTEVVTFLNRVAPSLQLKQVKQVFERADGGCAELVFFFQRQSVLLEEAHCLRIQDGQIRSIRLYYDPRPLLEASANQ